MTTRIRAALAALFVALALAACDNPDAADPRVDRLESDLLLAQQRAAEFEMRLAEATSRASEADLFQRRLEEAEARIAELEQAPGLSGSARQDRQREEAAERLSSALAEIAAAGRLDGGSDEADSESAFQDRLAAAATQVREAAAALDLELDAGELR